MTQIGSGLQVVLYILDEPSIGLHQHYNDRLIGTLKRLRDLGNSVIVVEHDEDTIHQGDHLVEMGSGVGAAGGQIVAKGAPEEAASGDAEDESEVDSDNGSDRPQEGAQNEEKRPGGKGQDEPKQSNVDTGK